MMERSDHIYFYLVSLPVLLLGLLFIVLNFSSVEKYFPCLLSYCNLNKSILFSSHFSKLVNVHTSIKRDYTFSFKILFRRLIFYFTYPQSSSGTLVSNFFGIILKIKSVNFWEVLGINLLKVLTYLYFVLFEFQVELVPELALLLTFR